MLKVIELFGGIGAMTQALKRLGVDFRVVDYVEIDKYAVASYNAMNGTDYKPQDVTEWNKDIECDLIMHGSPCQDFSVSGLNKGGDEGSGTRSSLMWETVRIVNKLKPKYVVWENVKNVVSDVHWHNFEKYLNAMASMGYASAWKVLNAKDYGVPQNRERVFVVSVMNGRTVYEAMNLFGDSEKKLDFEFPEPFPLKRKLKDILEEDVGEKYYLSVAVTLMARDWKGVNNYGSNRVIAKVKQIGNAYQSKTRSNPNQGRIYDTDGISPALTTMDGGGRQPMIVQKNSQMVKARKYAVDTDALSEGEKIITRNKRLEKLIDRTDFEDGKVLNLDIYNQTTNEDVSQTLTSPNHNSQALYDGARIRKLTPLETWRLQGQTDEAFYKARAVNSDTQLYKQAGNSICVDVLYYLMKAVLEQNEI